MAADTAGLIEAFELPRATLIGFSLGRLAAQKSALASLRSVLAAVLIGSLGRKDVTRRQLAQDAARDITATPLPAPSSVSRALQLFGPTTLGNDAWMARYLAGVEPSTSPTPGLVGQQLASSAYNDRLKRTRRH